MNERVGSFPDRIAFYGFRGGEGGISHVMLNLMNAVAARGVAVDILLHATNIPELSRLSPGIRVVTLGQGNEWRRIRALVSYFQKESPFALLANREPANRVAVVARQVSGVPVRLIFRVGMAISAALERRSLPKRLLRHWSMRYCYHRADLIIANAGGVAMDIETVLGIPPGRITVLANPTVSDDLQDQAEQPVEHPWFAPGAPPVLIGVGRLARQKDFPTLIRAFARVRQERHCRLMILGEGKERGDLLKLAAEMGVREDMELPGFIANPFRYMGRAAVFVLSSAWEGSPNVLIQALALGVPAVATDCPGGAKEILDDGRYGPLVPVGDPEALAKSIAEVLNDPLPREKLREGGKRFRTDLCALAYLEAIGSPAKGGRT